jgi:hypothetical protein
VANIAAHSKRQFIHAALLVGVGDVARAEQETFRILDRSFRRRVGHAEVVMFGRSVGLGHESKISNRGGVAGQGCSIHFRYWRSVAFSEGCSPVRGYSHAFSAVVSWRRGMHATVP